MRRSSRLRAKADLSQSVDLSATGQLSQLKQEYSDNESCIGCQRQNSRGRGEVSSKTSSSSSRARKAPSLKGSTARSARNRSKAKLEEPAGVSPMQAEPPEASLFPSLAYRLHGIASDGETFYGLVQELITPDVFGMIVVTILLNQTTGRAAIPVFYDLLYRWPTPALLAGADLQELTEVLQPIGLHNIRARRLKDLGRVWCEVPPRLGCMHKSRVTLIQPKKRKRKVADGSDEEPKRLVYPATEISHLPGVGRYALDSFRIFRPSLEQPERAAVQKGLGGEKATSVQWQAILKRRQEVGDEPEVGNLLPRLNDGHDEDDVLEEDWRQVDPLDKELKAYRIWRAQRCDR